MKFIKQSPIKLKSFSANENLGDVPEIKISNINFDDFNLFIGNNAQGKTRIMRIFQFMQGLVSGQLTRKLIKSKFECTFVFELLDAEKENPTYSEEVTYNLTIHPNPLGNRYSEIIKKNKAILLSTKANKILIDEDTSENINNFFIPQNSLAITSINEPRFKTVKLIREFFSRILFFESTQSHDIVADQKSHILNSQGSNLASLLKIWQQSYPELYKELNDDFRKCFNYISELKIGKFNNLAHETSYPVNMQEMDILLLIENSSSRQIPQYNWSQGLLRTLCLLSLPKTIFEYDSVVYPPSLICIDELENGLDFKTLEYIVNYLQTYSSNIQMIVSSHTPLMAQFIPLKDWRIVRRKGANIKATRPKDAEPDDLEAKLDLYNREYWEFYKNHVSESSLYDPS